MAHASTHDRAPVPEGRPGGVEADAQPDASEEFARHATENRRLRAAAARRTAEARLEASEMYFRAAAAEAESLGTRQRVAAAEAELDRTRQRVAAAEAELTRTRQRVATAEAELAGLREQMAAAENAAGKELSRAVAERDLILASTTWRATGPLRTVARLVFYALGQKA